MLEMSWDDELEAIAQRWTDQCEFGHDKIRGVKRFPVGQNSFVAMGNSEGTLSALKGVEVWYNEVSKLPNSMAAKFNGSLSAGHYTQMVYAESFKIGCGLTVFKGPKWGAHKFLACNYGRHGNVFGREIYTVGEACSKCSSGICSKKYPALCVSNSTAAQSSLLDQINDHVDLVEPVEDLVEPIEDPDEYYQDPYGKPFYDTGLDIRYGDDQFYTYPPVFSVLDLLQ